METGVGSLLIVDDEPLVRALLARSLGRAGFTITEAGDGRRALELIARHPFDLVLLDVTMPNLGGLETLTEVRRSRSPADLPVIMATGQDGSSHVVAALTRGANDYVTK